MLVTAAVGAAVSLTGHFALGPGHAAASPDADADAAASFAEHQSIILPKTLGSEWSKVGMMQGRAEESDVRSGMEGGSWTGL